MFFTGSRRAAPLVILAVLLVAGLVFAAGISDAVMSEFPKLEKYFGIPDGILAKIANIESGGDANARAKCGGCTASGLFQWTEASWTTYSAGLFKTPLGLGQRFNPIIAAKVTAFALSKARDNLGSLIAQSKMDMSAALYTAHFLGEGDARKFLTLLIQSPNANAGQAFPKLVKNNPAFFKPGITIAQVANLIAEKMKAPGIAGIKNYAGGAYDSASPSSINEHVNAGLQDAYTGPMPTSDPERGGYPFSSYNMSGSQGGQQQEPQQQGGQCPASVYCQGTILMEQNTSCTTRVVQPCDYGCSGSQCLPQQQCPQGSIMQNGQCMRLPQQQGQQNQPLSSAFNSGAQQQSAQQSPAQQSSGGGSGGGQGFPTNASSFDSISSILRPEETKLPQPDDGTPAYDSIVSISGVKPSKTLEDAGGVGGMQDGEAQGTDAGNRQDGQESSAALQPKSEAAGGIQTFTSEDLHDDPNAAGTSGFSDSQGAVMSTLTALKNLLLGIIAFVTPR